MVGTQAREVEPDEGDALAVETTTWLPVAEPVEAGDVLALSPEKSGELVRAQTMADPLAAGVALGPARKTGDGRLEAPLADGRYAEVKVDAGYGAIRPGDLLTTSPTPGHAMVAIDAPAGTILGKALEPLDVGTGTIRVLLMAR